MTDCLRAVLTDDDAFTVRDMRDDEKERLKQRLFPDTVKKDDITKKCMPVLEYVTRKRKKSTFGKRHVIFAVALCCLLVFVCIMLGVFLPPVFAPSYNAPPIDDGGDEFEDMPDIAWGEIFYASMSYLDMIAEFDKPEQVEQYLSETKFNADLMRDQSQVVCTKAYGDGGELSVLMQQISRDTGTQSTHGALFIVDDPMVKATLSYLKLMLSYMDVEGVPVYSGDSSKEGEYSSLFFFEHEGFYYVYGLTGTQPPDKEYYVDSIVG